MSRTRILVAGSSRSGSIWTAQMLAAGPGARCIVEPDNVNTDPSRSAAPDATVGFGPFPVLRPGDRAPHYAALWEMAFSGRVPGRKGWTNSVSRAVLRLPRPVRQALVSSAARVMGRMPAAPDTTVVQTVMAQFAIEWIVDRFDPRVVVIQRDPLNLVSSWLEWDVHGFDLATRPQVRARCAELGLAPPPFPESNVGRAAWWIGLVTAVLGRVATSHPDWLVVSHETLCADADGQFRRLYEALGLTWTPAADAFLAQTGYHMPTRRTHRGHGPSHGDAAAVRAQVTTKWRERLTDAQVAEATEVLAGFPERGWVSPPEPATAAPAPG